MHGIVDEKIDVFAFGVFVLEMISGRRPVDASHRSIIAWVRTYIYSRTYVRCMIYKSN